MHQCQNVHENVHDVEASVEKVMLKYVSFDLVEQLRKTEEEVRIEA